MLVLPWDEYIGIEVRKFQGAEIYKLRIVLGHNCSFADSASILRLKISRDDHGHSIAE